MRLRLLTLTLLFATAIAANSIYAQETKTPVIPDEKPLSLDMIQSVMTEKNAQIDGYQLSIARKDERIKQLTGALLAKQSELEKKEAACTTSNPDTKAKPGAF